MEKLQIVTLYYKDDLPTVYVDKSGTEDAFESQLAMIDHLREGYEAEMKLKWVSTI